MLAQLRVAYAGAVEAKMEQIVFDQHVFNTRYVKYLIEFLDARLAPN